MAATDIWTTQRRLTRILGAWGLGSVIVGEWIRRQGRRSGSDRLTGFGRQQSGWGAIDAVIAGVGAVNEARRVVDRDDVAVQAEAQAKLHRILRFNARLDIAYLAGAALLIAAAEPIGRRTRVSAAMIRGDGYGIAVQGGFLLLLDRHFESVTVESNQAPVTAETSRSAASRH